jgi:hypothetical protein
VTDPAHPLYGRIFALASAPRDFDGEGQLLVRYRDGIVLRVPRRATSLSVLGQDRLRDKLSRPAVEEFLSLVKEYESCLTKSPPAKSGKRSRPQHSKKSSRN